MPRLYSIVNTPSTKSPARSRVTTILLKILILRHLQVFDDHRREPAPCPRGHPLADALGEGRNRFGERVTDHDVYPPLVGVDDHPGHLLTRTVGRRLGVATRA